MERQIIESIIRRYKDKFDIDYVVNLWEPILKGLSIPPPVLEKSCQNPENVFPLLGRRKKLGLSLRDVEKATGINSGTVWRIERELIVNPEQMIEITKLYEKIESQ